MPKMQLRHSTKNMLLKRLPLSSFCEQRFLLEELSFFRNVRQVGVKFLTQTS